MNKILKKTLIIVNLLALAALLLAIFIPSHQKKVKYSNTDASGLNKVGIITDKRDIQLSFDLYNEEFLSTIGQQFLDKALEKGDNLDYVFITNRTDFNRIVKSDKFPKIVDESFFVNLPHCDLSFAVNAIGYNDFENDIDPDLEVFTTYKKERKKIQISEENYKKDMLRIKALSIFDKEEYAKEKYKEEFDLIMKNDYKIIITGQDWYVALRSDNKIERTLLFTTDDRQNMEFNSAFRFVLNEYKNSNDDEIGLKRISK